MIITKGDLLDQESKIERSGLGRHFKYIEIVSDKNPASYAALLARHNLRPQGFVMVGNSLALRYPARPGRSAPAPSTSPTASPGPTSRSARRSCTAPSTPSLENLGQLPELLAR